MNRSIAFLKIGIDINDYHPVRLEGLNQCVDLKPFRPQPGIFKKGLAGPLGIDSRVACSGR